MMEMSEGGKDFEGVVEEGVGLFKEVLKMGEG